MSGYYKQILRTCPTHAITELSSFWTTQHTLLIVISRDWFFFVVRNNHTSNFYFFGRFVQIRQEQSHISNFLFLEDLLKLVSNNFTSIIFIFWKIFEKYSMNKSHTSIWFCVVYILKTFRLVYVESCVFGKCIEVHGHTSAHSCLILRFCALAAQ